MTNKQQWWLVVVTGVVVGSLAGLIMTIHKLNKVVELNNLKTK